MGERERQRQSSEKRVGNAHARERDGQTDPSPSLQAHTNPTLDMKCVREDSYGFASNMLVGNRRVMHTLRWRDNSLCVSLPPPLDHAL